MSEISDCPFIPAARLSPPAAVQALGLKPNQMADAEFWAPRSREFHKMTAISGAEPRGTERFTVERAVRNITHFVPAAEKQKESEEIRAMLKSTVETFDSNPNGGIRAVVSDGHSIAVGKYWIVAPIVGKHEFADGKTIEFLRPIIFPRHPDAFKTL